MEYFKLQADDGTLFRSFEGETTTFIEVYNGTFHKRLVKVDRESVFNHVWKQTAEQLFMPSTKEEFERNKSEVQAILSAL